MKRQTGRDLPHPKRERGPDQQRGATRTRARVMRADGTSFPVNMAGEEPRRPVISMLFEDLGDPETPPGVLGMYPESFIPKILPWLRCERHEILHVCSGGLPPGEGIRVDIRPEAKPDFVADGRKLPFEACSQAAILIDPPYSEHYARELYGTEYPRPAHLLAEAARVARHNARVAIVHYIVPNTPRGCAFVRAFGLSMGFGYPMRAVTIYEKGQPALFDGEAPPPSPRQARRRRKINPA
jgi:hypothetical protein